MALYPFQEQVYRFLSAGKSVILQAPTGAGKTRAALYPFLRAWEYEERFPRKCIYSVPLRVLADQFEETYSRDVANFGFARPMDVTIQTGARSDDRKMEGNLIFTTVDQTLSNFLNIPYALSTSQGNLNAGAVLESYLVFDELHLFDPGTMLPTVLHLLRMLRDVIPFLVMTATLSEEMVQALAKQVGAETVVLSAKEAAAIPSQRKTRRLHRVDGELTASAVLEKHQAIPAIPRRSIAICNTVGRAQALFEDLRSRADSDTHIRLLHSRFLQGDREAAENWLRREFGKEKGDYTVESAILVATQVVEVGLDITSQALHTELAPAASVIQRAGRCARYQDEVGDVYVCRLPPDRNGHPSYAPYLEEQKEICINTWEALAKRSGEPFDFEGELAIVNEAHGEADRRILDRLSANRHYLVDRIAETIEAQERGAARELIRDVDSRTVIVHPRPGDIENPWIYEGLGIFRGTLFGAYESMVQLADDLDEDWVAMTADPLPEEESSREHTVWRWRHIVDKDDLEGVFLVAVNPRLARYSAETGFRLGIPGDADWQSPLRQRTRQREAFAPYRRETFQEHVVRMQRVYEHPFYDRRKKKERLALSEELAYAAGRLEDRFGWEAGTLDRLAQAVIALHDLGKLDVRWQAWAHGWQEQVSALRGQDLSIPLDYMAAHTDYDGQNQTEEALNRKLHSLRPNHAVESARAAEDLLWEHTGEEALLRAALTVIARHHSAGARGSHEAFEAHPAAKTALAEVLDGLDPVLVHWHFPEGTLARKLVRPNREPELLVYLLLVRALRLADQRSQQL
jgi:CRISPR-associated endonuclease/helicase Cas3